MFKFTPIFLASWASFSSALLFAVDAGESSSSMDVALKEANIVAPYVLTVDRDVKLVEAVRAVNSDAAFGYVDNPVTITWQARRTVRALQQAAYDRNGSIEIDSAGGPIAPVTFPPPT